MPRVFIDTNVLLDVLCKRPQFMEDGFRLIDLAIDCKLELMISDLSIANIRYITRKELTKEKFYEVMKSFRSVLTVVPVGAEAVDCALALEADDFEDALQYFSAKQAGADCLLTRNMKHYTFASIEVATPHDFLKKYFFKDLEH